MKSWSKKPKLEKGKKLADILKSKKLFEKIVNLILTYPGCIFRSGSEKILDILDLPEIISETREEVGHMVTSYVIKCALLEADNLGLKKSGEIASCDNTVLQTYPVVKHLLTKISTAECVKMKVLDVDFKVEKIDGKKWKMTRYFAK
jgi:hypothetical protein